MPNIRSIFAVLFTVPYFLFLLPHPVIADAQCPDDKYYIDTRYGEGACIHKHSGYSAPGDPRADSTECVYTYEGATNGLCSPAEPATIKGDLGSLPAGVLQLQELIRRIINISVGLGFMFVTIMLVVAGIKYLVSGGEPKALSSAAGTVTWALLGALFLALAWIIMLLIKALTGVDILNFCIGFPGVPPACDFK